MTEPSPSPGKTAPADLGNALLGETPVQWSLTLAQTPLGQRLVHTIRTPSTTLTVFLQKADAVTWAQNLKDKADQMSASGLVVPPNGFRPQGSG